ncbi:MAG: carbohydrate kinase [Chloroflexi bacterium HGW-Chloroflexi-8]|nr:MAG: carbohydrate kinase [Chloroflexi bacterium HGW-Chloroflexi-8]
MSEEFILSIDIGTQSVRAMIFDLKGNLVAKSRVLIEDYASPIPGYAELDPIKFWKSLCQACNSLWEKFEYPKSSIKALALTTQRSTLINLDKNGEPLRPAIVWLDQRRTENLPPIKGLWGLAFSLTGMHGTVNYLKSEAECNWIRTNQPDIWEKTDKFLLLSGYITHKLTNEYRDSIGCQVAYIPFDYKSQKYASKFDWKWQAVPMDINILPELVQPGSVLGYVTKNANAETGIPEGLPLIAAAADKACEVIGSGCLQPNVACLSFGTTATINTTHKKYTEVIPLIPPYPSAIPGYYSLEIQIYRGFWMVSWFKREFGQNEQRLANDRGIEAEELFDNLVNSVPPGSLGLTLQPFWSPGLKRPGPEAKGAIIGFGDIHTRAHFYRSILEGLAYALRDGAEKTVIRSHVPITDIRVAGGGSQSDAAMQITADVFGLPVSRPHVYEASGLGAAIDAAVGSNMYADFDSAIKEMTRTSTTFEPNMQTHKIYDDLYHQVYQPMYKRLKPLYENIRDITGYPPK